MSHYLVSWPFYNVNFDFYPCRVGIYFSTSWSSKPQRPCSFTFNSFCSFKHFLFVFHNLTPLFQPTHYLLNISNLRYADSMTLNGRKQRRNFLKFIYFSWRLITLQYCSGFCHTLIWISHGFTCVPHPEHPSHLLPHPIPQGYPSAPALSTLSHASNLDWRSVSHIIIYMFQCYSLRSSHPCPVPQRPKECSIYLCPFSVSHIGLSLPSF